MAHILVTETIADSGLQAMRDAGHDVHVRKNLSPEQLLDAIELADALVIRSSTKVTADVLNAGTRLKVIGRAGIGLDNVDVATATTRGVMVVNAPESNILSAAEHTIALLLAQARNIPQAHSALKLGKWERSKWEGVELQGKTLGVVGLGRVGGLVVPRAQAFGLRVLAYDPYIPEERARQLNVEQVSLDELMQQADFLCVHLPKTPETIGLIGEKQLAMAKPNLRVVNTARGGIIDEAALAKAVEKGQIAGAALDVFSEEPITASPLFELDSVVVTPHLGASTVEAQDKAGITIAEQVVLALNNDFVPFATNVPAREANEAVRPYINLAEQLGRILGCLVEGVPTKIDITYQGTLAEHDTRILNLSLLKGIFAVDSENVSYVNALTLSEERGIVISTTAQKETHDYVAAITVRSGVHGVSATLIGERKEPKIFMIDDHFVEVPPAPHMLVVRNDDRPGMIGVVGTSLGSAGVNIGDMALGRNAKGDTALILAAVDHQVPDEVVNKLRATEGVLDVRDIEL